MHTQVIYGVRKISRLVAIAASATIVSPLDGILGIRPRIGAPTNGPGGASAADTLQQRPNSLPRLSTDRSDLRPFLPLLCPPQLVLRRGKSFFDSHGSPDACSQPCHKLRLVRLAGSVRI